MASIRDKAEDTAFKFITGFINFFYPKILKGIKQIVDDAKAITWRNIIIDVTDVASSLGMFLVLNIIALFIFIVMPAGRDVLLVMVEDIVSNQQYGNLFGLILGVICWSIASEFAARYAIYVSDNSALTLDDKRVKFRKTLQKAFAAFFLLLPYLLVMISLVINYSNSNPEDRKENWQGYLITAIIFYLLLNKISHLYFDEKLNNRMRENREGNWFNRLVILPDKELKWAEKLYGIYNTHVYAFPKATNFRDKPGTEEYSDDGLSEPDPSSPRGKLWAFIKSVIDTGNVSELLSFPQDDKKLIPEKKIPQQFRLIGFSKEVDKKEGNYFWKYRIPISFYRTLHRQVRLIFFVCLAVFLLISFLPVMAYENIGAPALIFISFGCICGLYVGVIYLDYTNRFFKKIPIRLLLLVLFLVGSKWNNDHMVRMDCSDPGIVQTIIKTPGKPDQVTKALSKYNMDRPSLNAHFKEWAETFIADSANAYRFENKEKPDSNKMDTCYPVLFICAEGGALRTGAFSSFSLSMLQDSLNARVNNKVDINKSIYGMSGVSGGSLGLGAYYAFNYLTDPRDRLQNMTVQTADSTFFNNDFLSPLIGKMFFGEFLQLFIPWHIESFDRAIALEKSWEVGYGKLVKTEAPNVFHSNFSLLRDKTAHAPALFVNTSEVETGLQCWLTNVDPGNLMFSNQRDLFKNKINGDMHFSTLINFSSRFPGFSPAATIIKDETKKFHYVDGGYVENTGAGTMLEMLQELRPLMKHYKIKPFVLVFRYSPDSESHTNLDWFNEVTEIVSAIYNTRSGRTQTAIEQLKNYTTDSFKTQTCIVPLDVTSRNSPQNWAMSKRNLCNIIAYSRGLWDKQMTGPMKTMYFFDTTNYKKVKK